MCHCYIHQKRAVILGMSDGGILVWKDLTRDPADAAWTRQVVDKKPVHFKPSNGHKGTIHQLLYLPKYDVIVTGSADRTIKVWDPWAKEVEKGMVQNITDHGGTVLAIIPFDEGRMLISSGTDMRVKIWAPEEGREMLMYPRFVQVGDLSTSCSFTEWVRSLACFGDELYVGEGSGHITCIKFQTTKDATGQPKVSMKGAEKPRRFPCHSMGITHMLYVGDNLLVSISFDCTVRVTDVREGRKRMAIKNPSRSRYVGLAFYAEQQELYLLDDTGKFEIWGLQTERLLATHQLAPFGKTVGGLSYHLEPPPVGCPGKPLDFCLVHQADIIESHKFERDLPHKEMEGHSGPVVSVVSVETKGGTRSDGHPDDEEEATPTEGEVPPNGTGSEHGSVHTTTSVFSMSDNHVIYTASVDNTWKNWDPKELQCRLTMSEVTSEIRCMTYAPQNRVVITGNDDGTIRLWNPEGGSPTTCEGHDNTISCLDVGVLHKQEYLFSGSFDGSVAMWDISRRSSKSSLVVNHMALGDFEVQCICYCEHLGYVLAGCNDGTIHLYDPLRSTLVQEFRGHIDSVTCLALDGNFVISGAEDRTIRVWNLLTGQQLKLLKKHRRSVEDLLVLEASGTIVSCATDGWILCWDYTNERVIHQIEQHEEFISIAFKESTSQVIAGTESSKVLLFPLPPDVTEARERGDPLAPPPEVEEEDIMGDVE